MATILREATVVSGRGIASKKIETLHKKLLFNKNTLFPGTLNLVLKEPIVFNPEAAENTITSQISFYPIQLNSQECWVRRYSQCPLHILEVVSTVKLRDTLHLKDGNIVQLAIPKTAISQLGFFGELLWYLAWKGREYWFYKHTWYAIFISRFLNFRASVQKLFI